MLKINVLLCWLLPLLLREGAKNVVAEFLKRQNSPQTQLFTPETLSLELFFCRLGDSPNLWCRIFISRKKRCTNLGGTLAHCCAIFLGHLGIEKEIIWLGNQLGVPPTPFSKTLQNPSVKALRMDSAKFLTPSLTTCCLQGTITRKQSPYPTTDQQTTTGLMWQENTMEKPRQEMALLMREGLLGHSTHRREETSFITQITKSGWSGQTTETVDLW